MKRKEIKIPRIPSSNTERWKDIRVNLSFSRIENKLSQRNFYKTLLFISNNDYKKGMLEVPLHQR